MNPEELDITDVETRWEILASIDEMLETFGLSRHWDLTGEQLTALPINAYVWLCHRFTDLQDAIAREEDPWQQEYRESS